MFVTNSEYIKNAAVKRPLTAHKGSMGTLLSVCGSYGMAGAAILSARAALRSGVGLLKIACVKALYPILASSVPEAVYIITEDEYYFTEKSLDMLYKAQKEATAVLIGCGLGQKAETINFALDFIKAIQTPLLIDADGINAVSKHINILRQIKSKDVIFTPHPKEMARLTDLSVAQVQENREKTAVDFAKKYGVTALLKGHNTIISDKNGNAFLNPTGNPGLAKGGSGDVLSGIIASLSAQGMCGFDAAVSGAYIHGKTADILVQKMSQASILPSDVAENVYLGMK